MVGSQALVLPRPFLLSRYVRLASTPPLCLVRECGRILIVDQGIAGLTARDVKLVVDGGFHTVESVAYT
jgi:hypothetical protein